MSALTVDLTDVDAFVAQRHHAMLATLRRTDPVYWNRTQEGDGFWALTRYDDIVAAYRADTVFSSAGGPMLGGSFKARADTAANRMLVASDNPRHRQYRQVMHQVFAPEYQARVAERVGELVDAALDRALAAGGCDAAVDLAWELPAGALMAIVGIPRSDALELIRLTRRMIGFRDPAWNDTLDDERLQLAVIQSEIFAYFADLLRDRRRNPGSDLVSVLARARVNGRPMPEEDILFNCMNVAVGGNETSSYTAVAGLLALLEHPDQDARLRGQPGLLDGAVEEMLRWASTNAYVLRVATRDTQVRDKLIRAGDPVTLWNVSANRDDDQFPAPDRFDVARWPNRHITYGLGIHRCIGAPVAQRELQILFRRLLARDVHFALDGPVTRLRSNFIQGITSLPVRMSAGRERDA